MRPIAVQRSTDPNNLALRDEPQEAPPIEKVALKKAPPWLISMLVHMLLILVLGLWAVQADRDKDTISLDVYSDRLGEQLENDSIALSNDLEVEAEQIITPSNLPEVSDPFAAPPQIDVTLDGDSPQIDIAAPTIGLALKGRDAGMKESLLKGYGGNQLTEDAVTAALEWLSRQQNRKDGSWSLKGPYKSGSQYENQEAATAMALLAFQGAGNTHLNGTYKKQVAAGVKAMLRWQDKEGNFFQGGRNHDSLYTQAQCTIAICELYGMSKDESLRQPAELAIEYCVKSQDSLGGWRYEPRNDSDTSVTGWMVMALQSAKMAGLIVPSTTLEKIGEYLDQASSDGGSHYGYQVGMEPTKVMTAEGLLCRQYLGWAQDDPRLVAGADYIAQNLPRWDDRDVYYWYYGTQMMHHMEGKYWPLWNEALRDMLVEHQEKKGTEHGSWDPLGKSPDAWAARGYGGRLYATCLSTFMLEVYYRHLPIYSKLRQQLAQP